MSPWAVSVEKCIVDVEASERRMRATASWTLVRALVLV